MALQDDKQIKTSAEDNVDRPESAGRRALLRKGVTAMPAILTLHSGAALARSSNLISAAPGSRDGNGDVWCMDTSTADYYPDSGKYDIGDPGFANVNVLPDTDYYSGPGLSGDVKTADEFCASGGVRNYKPLGGGSKETATLQSPGIVVSSNAYNSVATRVEFWVKHWP